MSRGLEKNYIYHYKMSKAHVLRVLYVVPIVFVVDRSWKEVRTHSALSEALIQRYRDTVACRRIKSSSHTFDGSHFIICVCTFPRWLMSFHFQNGRKGTCDEMGAGTYTPVKD